MDKRQISSVVIVALAIVFIGASVASSKLKTLKKIKAGSITNPYIGDGAVNSAKIEDGTVSNADYADNSITAGKIADGEVNVDDLGDNSVSTGEIVDGSVTSAKILDGTIAAGDLADSAVTSAKISDGTIANADINSSAAIAGTKVSPNFGSQNVTTTGDGNFLSVSVDDVIYGTSGKLYVDGALSANGLFIDPSAVSGNSVIASTAPSETCDADNRGSYELVDDEDDADVYLWICQRSGPASYTWKMISTP